MTQRDHIHPDLRQWLAIATRGLCTEARERIASDIGEHWQEAVDCALEEGQSAEGASQTALDSSGDPRAARRRFKRAHLTARELRWVDDLYNAQSELEAWRKYERFSSILRNPLVFIPLACCLLPFGIFGLFMAGFIIVSLVTGRLALVLTYEIPRRLIARVGVRAAWRFCRLSYFISVPAYMLVIGLKLIENGPPPLPLLICVYILVGLMSRPPFRIRRAMWIQQTSSTRNDIAHPQKGAKER